MELGEIVEGSGRSSVRVFGLGVLGETKTLESRKVLLRGQEKKGQLSVSGIPLMLLSHVWSFAQLP